jgi:hypothetical protein
MAGRDRDGPVSLMIIGGSFAAFVAARAPFNPHFELR